MSVRSNPLLLLGRALSARIATGIDRHVKEAIDGNVAMLSEYRPCLPYYTCQEGPRGR